MYSNQLKSPIASFLAMCTDNMKLVRDNIPAGPQFFKFFFRLKELNWYEFWDHIADNRPVDCKLVTAMFTVAFNDVSLKWECVVKHDSVDTEATVNIICSSLNENYLRSSIINSWERHKH